MAIVIDKILGTALMHDHGSSGGTALLLDGSNSPMTGSLGIEGSSDEIQLYVKGHSTQTSNLFSVRNNSNVELMVVEPAGHVTLANGTTNTPSLRFIPTGANPSLYFYMRNSGLVVSTSGTNVGRLLDFFNAVDGSGNSSGQFRFYGNACAMYPLGPGVSNANNLGLTGNRWNITYSYRAEIDQLTMAYNGDQSPAINMTLQSGQTAPAIRIKDNSTNDLIVLSATGGAIFNENGNDADFRIESDNYDAFFVDASNDSVAVMNNASGKVGFYATTPTTQQTLSTGAGATVDNVITALQNLGLVKQ